MINISDTPFLISMLAYIICLYYSFQSIQVKPCMSLYYTTIWKLALPQCNDLPRSNPITPWIYGHISKKLMKLLQNTLFCVCNLNIFIYFINIFSYFYFLTYVHRRFHTNSCQGYYWILWLFLAFTSQHRLALPLRCQQ